MHHECGAERQRLVPSKTADDTREGKNDSNDAHPAMALTPACSRRHGRDVHQALLSQATLFLLVVFASTSMEGLLIEGHSGSQGHSISSSSSVARSSKAWATFEKPGSTTGHQVPRLARDGGSDWGPLDWVERPAGEGAAAANSAALGEVEEGPHDEEHQLMFSEDASTKGEFTSSSDLAASLSRRLQESDGTSDTNEPAQSPTGAPVGCGETSDSPPIMASSSQSVERPGSIVAAVASVLVLVGVLVIPLGSLAKTDRGVGSKPTDGALGGVGVDGTMVSAPEGRIEESRSHVSNRRPSATLAIMLMTQLQFLATLSFIDYPVQGDCFLLDLLKGLRWVNLSFPTNVFSVVESEASGTAEPEEESEAGTFIFVNNIVLVLGILVVVFVLHVAWVSGVEAYWLTRERPKRSLTTARHRAAPIAELWALFRGGTTAQRTSPGLDGSDGGELSATQSPYNCKPFTGDTESDDEEEGWCGSAPCRSKEGCLNPVGACREQTRSACLCFPHIELMFLLFAFEGAVASQAWAIGDGYDESPAVFCLALAALLLFPVLMTLVILRIIYLRVCPNEYIVFNDYSDDGVNHDAAPIGGRRNFISNLRSSWSVDHKLFAWADKGQWKTDQAQSLQATQEGDRFRKGFEPVFVDFTKYGTLFVVLFLVARAAFACIAILMDNITLQLFLFCGIHVAMFVMLACLEPFANRVINTIAACLAAVDAISTGLMAGSTLSCPETGGAGTTNVMVVALQLAVLCVLICAVYLDAVIMMSAICCNTKERRSKAGLDHSQMKAEEQKEYESIRRCTIWRWFGAWCTLLRKNASSCASNTREGVRRPHALTAARSGPLPSLERSGWSGEGSMPHQLGDDGGIGDVQTPTIVLDDKLKTVGARARAWGGIATPARRLPLNNGGIITAHSFNISGSAEAVPSGRVVIQQGENSSTGKLASPIDASADRFAFFSRRHRDPVDSDSPTCVPPPIVPSSSVTVKEASSGREMIQRGQDSSWRLGNTWTMPSASNLFGSNQRDNHAIENDAPPMDSPVLVSKLCGRTMQSYQNGTGLAAAIHALESSSCEESPSPRRAAPFEIGGVSPEWGEDDRRRIMALCSGGPEIASSSRFSTDQSNRQFPQQHQIDRQLHQHQINRQSLQRVPRPSNDPESFVPPLTLDNHARANRPIGEQVGGPPDVVLAADELVNATIQGDLPTGNNSLREITMLDSAAASVCSSGKSRASNHPGLDHGASQVEASDTCRVQVGLKDGMDASASKRNMKGGANAPLLPRGIRCPVEIDLPRRFDREASQVGASNSGRGEGGTKGVIEAPALLKGTRHSIEIDFLCRLDREANQLDTIDTGMFEGGMNGRMDASASKRGCMDAPALSRSMKDGMEAPVLPRGNRSPIEADFPRRLSTIPFEQLGSGAGSDHNTDSSRSHGPDDEIWNGPRAALRGITAVFQNSADSSFPRRKSFSSAEWEPPADGEGSGSVLSESVAEPKKPEQDTSLLHINSINWRAWDDMATINASWKNTPFALDQPRRRSQRRASREISKGTAASSSWRSYKSTEDNPLMGNKNGRGDGETTHVKGRDGSRRDMRGQHSARASVSVLAKLVSHKRGPVQSDLPRRRSSEISVRNGAAIVPIDDTSGAVCDDGKNSPVDERKDNHDARSLEPTNTDSTNMPGRGGARTGVQSRAPISAGVELNDGGGGRPGLQSRTSVAIGLDLSCRGSGRPDLQSRTPVATGRAFNDISGSSHPVPRVNGAGYIQGGQEVHCRQCQEEATIGRDAANLAGGVVGMTLPARQGSRRDHGADGGGGGTIPVSPVEQKPRSPEFVVSKGRGVSLLMQYSNGFSDGDDELDGEDEGKVAAW